jgi:hypothetical protein
VLRRLRTEIAKLPGGRATADALLALLPAKGAGVELSALCHAAPDIDDIVVDDALVCALADRLGAAGEALSDNTGRRYFALAGSHEQHLAV